jgi:hypothetical protein
LSKIQNGNQKEIGQDLQGVFVAKITKNPRVSRGLRHSIASLTMALH